MKQVTRDLLEAHKLLLERGWLRGWYHGRAGAENERALCVNGAFMTVAGVEPLYMPDYSNPRVRAMRNVFMVANQLPSTGDGHGIAQWNDEDGRTVEEVLKALRLAAAWAESFDDENVVA